MRLNGPVVRSWFVTAVSVMALVVSAGLMGCGGGGGGGGNGGWRFAVTDLGTLGGASSRALSVNTAGHAVGWSQLPDSNALRAFLWDGTMRDLGLLLGAATSEAAAINDDGVICGTVNIGLEDQRAFRWENNVAEDLGTVSPWINAAALDINDVGEIVGDSGNRPFIWRDGEMETLPTPADTGWATGVNRHGQISGAFWRADLGVRHGFTGSRTTAVDLDPAGTRQSMALAINDSEHVVGFQEDGDTSRAFVYRSGALENLGTLGGQRAEAWDINNGGVIVGLDDTAAGVRHAFLWDGEMHDLNDLVDSGLGGGTLIAAYGIANNNIVVGQMQTATGTTHAFIARPL